MDAQSIPLRLYVEGLVQRTAHLRDAHGCGRHPDAAQELLHQSLRRRLGRRRRRPRRRHVSVTSDADTTAQRR
jgi:hypothetical protein